MRKWVIYFLLAAGGLGLLVGLFGPKEAPNAAQHNAATPVPSAANAGAEKALRAEPKIKDLLFQPDQAVQWQIGVLDDGTNRVGYARYVCEVLKDHGALQPNSHVRIVDIAKISGGVGFRDAALGHVACADGSVVTP